MNETQVRNDFGASPGESAQRACSGRILWALCILLLAYPLSAGPAVWLEIKVPATQPTVEALYKPLSTLCERCPPLQQAMFFYLAVVWRIPFGC